MSFGKMLSKIFYKEATKSVNQRAKQRAINRYKEKANMEYVEKQKQNDIIYQQKVKFFQEKIDIADAYLRDVVDLLGMFKKKQKLIESWFFTNYWLKSLDERKVPANYNQMQLTMDQKQELLEKLNIQPEEYVQHELSSTDKDSTLAFVIDNTNVVMELRSWQNREGYRLYIAPQYTDLYTKNITICFGLVIREDAKQPF